MKAEKSKTKSCRKNTERNNSKNLSQSALVQQDRGVVKTFGLVDVGQLWIEISDILKVSKLRILSCIFGMNQHSVTDSRAAIEGFHLEQNIEKESRYLPS